MEFNYTEAILESLFYLIPQLILVVATSIYLKHTQIVSSYCLFFGSLVTLLTYIFPLASFVFDNAFGFYKNLRVIQWIASAIFAIGLYLLIKEHVIKKEASKDINKITGINKS